MHLFGKFDHHRLIDTLRIFPSPPSSKGNNKDESIESGLGVEEGGLKSAEALLLEINELKPHIPVTEAHRAIEEVEKMRKDFRAIKYDPQRLPNVPDDSRKPG